MLNGNEVGVLLLDFIARNRIANGTMPKHPIAVKTIVSTDLTDSVAKEYGIELRNVLTGFKYIGDQIAGLEANGEESRYIFGFEESYGYLSGSYVRDKDTVNASMLVCEMAVDYKKQGKTLVDAIHDIYEKHGYFLNELMNFTFEGQDGMNKMQQLWSICVPILQLKSQILQWLVGVTIKRLNALKVPWKLKLHFPNPMFWNIAWKTAAN